MSGERLALRAGLFLCARQSVAPAYSMRSCSSKRARKAGESNISGPVRVPGPRLRSPGAALTLQASAPQAAQVNEGATPGAIEPFQIGTNAAVRHFLQESGHPSRLSLPTVMRLRIICAGRLERACLGIDWRTSLTQAARSGMDCAGVGGRLPAFCSSALSRPRQQHGQVEDLGRLAPGALMNDHRAAKTLFKSFEKRKCDKEAIASET